MHWRRFGAGIAAAGTLGTGGTVAVDATINPYEVSAEKYELASISTLEAAGENKVEAHRDRPAVTLSRWNGEAAMTVAYGDINAEGSREFLTDRVEWKGDTEELHAYPLPAAEGMEDGGFEIEVYLRERPASNTFRFAIEGAEELDFFYQPELTAEEIEEGALRPENVVGSYAVYHKTKANHRVGDTNYATGKAVHIHRPKAIDANGAEVWADLSYSEGVLAVTVPQEWLQKATYPVVVDPTFGYTSVGSSGTPIAQQSSDRSRRRGNTYTAPEAGTLDKFTASLSVTSGTENVDTAAIMYLLEGDNTHAQIAISEISNHPYTTTKTWIDFTMASQGFSAVDLILTMLGNGVDVATVSNAASVSFDSVSISNVTTSTTGASSYTTEKSNPWSATPAAANIKISVYATYTAAGGGDSVPPDDGVVWFE